MKRTMKLMICLNCGDILMILRARRWCYCRSCSGQRSTIFRVQVTGPCAVLGIRKEDYHNVILDQPLTAPLQYWIRIPEGDPEVERT